MTPSAVNFSFLFLYTELTGTVILPGRYLDNKENNIDLCLIYDLNLTLLKEIIFLVVYI